MEATVVSKTGEEEFQAFALDQPIARRVVDNEVGEVWLTGDWAERCKFWTDETREIERIRVRVLNPFQLRLIWRARHGALLS